MAAGASSSAHGVQGFRKEGFQEGFIPGRIPGRGSASLVPQEAMPEMLQEEGTASAELELPWIGTVPTLGSQVWPGMLRGDPVPWQMSPGSAAGFTLP